MGGRGLTHDAYVLPLYPETAEPANWERPRRLTLVEPELEEDFIAPTVSETHWAPWPTKWVEDPPARVGVYQVRPPGADGYAFVEVYEKDGVLLYRPYRFRMSMGGVVPPGPRHGAVAELEWGNRPVLEPR